MTRWKAMLPAVVVVVAAACEDAAGPGREALEVEDGAVVALEADAAVAAVIELAMADFPVGSGEAIVLYDTRPIDRSRACPRGGEIVVTGEVERTRSDGGVVEWTVSGSGAWNECGHARGDRLITIDGEFEFEAYRRRVNGVFSGPQTTHKRGFFTWVRGDRTGECEFEITTVRNPAEDRRTVTGSVCGRAIDRSLSWGRSG